MFVFRFDVEPAINNPPALIEPEIDYSEYVDNTKEEEFTNDTLIGSNESFEKEDIYHIRNKVANSNKC